MDPRHFQPLVAQLDGLEMPAWIKDRCGKYLAVNSGLAWHLSTRPSDMLGRSQAEFWPEAAVKQFDVDDRTAMARRRAIAVPEHHDDRGFLLTVKLPLYSSDESPAGTLGVFVQVRADAWHREPGPLAAHLGASLNPSLQTIGLQGLSAEVDTRPLVRPTLNDPETPRWLSALRLELEENFKQPHRIQDLARSAGVHPRHAGRSFRRAFGMSVSDYRARLRTDWCRMELLSSDRPAREIAIEAGFADQSHFIRVFKSQSGMTPGVFRAVRGHHPPRDAC